MPLLSLNYGIVTLQNGVPAVYSVPPYVDFSFFLSQFVSHFAQIGLLLIKD